MRWKRGLTRFYVVLWAVWAGFFGYLAASQTFKAYHTAKLRHAIVTVRLPNGEVVAFPGTRSRAAMEARCESLWTAARNEPDTGLAGVPGNVPMWAPDGGELSVPQEDAAEVKRLGATLTPLPPPRVEGLKGAWGWFVGFGLVVPGLLLLAVCWVWAGFERRAEPKA